MGYKPGRKVYHLKFDEAHELHGLELKVKSIPMHEFADLSALADKAQSPTATAAEAESQIDTLYNFFLASLVWWNVEDEDDQPVAMTVESLKAHLDFEFVIQVILAWMTEIASVAAPFVASSNSGGTSVAPSLPMETLSPSRAS